MNATERMNSMACVSALASAVTLVRHHFPSASVSLSPWRDDPQTREWFEAESLDFAFHFPGWSPRLQCRSLLMQLRIQNSDNERAPQLLGVLLRGMTFAGERWRIVTVGDWQPSGAFLPQLAETKVLHQICRDLFTLFPSLPEPSDR